MYTCIHPLTLYNNNKEVHIWKLHVLFMQNREIHTHYTIIDGRVNINAAETTFSVIKKSADFGF